MLVLASGHAFTQNIIPVQKWGGNKKNTGSDSTAKPFVKSSKGGTETKVKDIDSLNNKPAFSIIGNAGAGILESIKNATGNINIGFNFRISKYQQYKPKRYAAFYLAAMWNTKIANSNDSGSIAKNYLFPEIAKRDFVLSIYKQYVRESWSMAPIFEIALNTYKDSSGNKSFQSQSLLLGTRFSKEFSIEIAKEEIPVSLILLPYYNIINVDSKYAANHQALLKEAAPYASLHAIGMQTIVQIDKLNLFCNMKYILSNSSKIENPDLKRFVYTIGTLISL